MEFEPWMLLVFPLFFGMGWLAARMDIKQLVDESSALPRSYFQGLNFLLNEQQDKAIDAFIEVVKVDPQTVELHFALGSLFRRRGEVDRALRMHLNLAERADLDEDKKQQALFELAQDYLKAGILDRAESIFLDLRNTRYAKQALEFLLEIYQKEKDWLKAIDITQRLTVVTGEPHLKEAAYFFCELAAEDLDNKRPDSARAHLAQALETWPNLARATMMLGDMEKAGGNIVQAIETWQHIEQQDPRYLPLVAERLLGAYRESGNLDEGIEFLRGYLAKHHSLDLMNVVSTAILERDGPDAAYQLVRDELHSNPTLLGLDRLLETRLLNLPEERQSDVVLVRKLLHQRTSALSMYRCSSCGFKARQFYWHCPACHGWETYTPRHAEEGGQPL
jgi:lipopolysaccharide biosynthesis regulator YciM